MFLIRLRATKDRLFAWASATTARSIAEFSCFIVQSGDSANISLGAVRLVDMGLS